MRLLHSILLSSVIVLASRSNPLANHTPTGENGDVSSGGFRQSINATVDGVEDRGCFSMSKSLVKGLRRMFPASRVTRAMWRAKDKAAEFARIKRGAAEKAEKVGNELAINFAEKAEKAKIELTANFEEMMKLRAANKEMIDTFIASQDYDDLIASIHKANKGVPLDYAIKPLSFIMSKLSQEDQLIMIEAADGSPDPVMREVGINLFRLYIRQYYTHPKDLKVIQPPKDELPRI